MKASHGRDVDCLKHFEIFAFMAEGQMDVWALVGLGCLQLAGFVALYLLFVQNGRVLLRIDAIEKNLHGFPDSASAVPDLSGLPRGSVLTDFSLQGIDGKWISLSQFRGRQVLLIFFNPDCAFCLDFLEAWAAARFAAANRECVIISQGNADETRRLFAQFAAPYPVLIETGAELSSLYRVRATPTGYLVDETGRTADDLLAGPQALLNALKIPEPPKRARGQGVTKSLAHSRIVRDGLKAGTAAPLFTLPALDGKEVSLATSRGMRTLIVFSDPQCQPCQELMPKLDRLHRSTPDLAVLMISRGDIGLNREKAAAHRPGFPIVLQRHWEISRLYGIFATPAGYLIDESGVLASDAVVGGEAILNLTAQGPIHMDGRPSMVDLKS